MSGRAKEEKVGGPTSPTDLHSASFSLLRSARRLRSGGVVGGWKGWTSRYTPASKLIQRRQRQLKVKGTPSYIFRQRIPSTCSLLALEISSKDVVL